MTGTCSRCGAMPDDQCRGGCPRTQAQFREWALGVHEGKTGQPLRKEDPFYIVGWIRGRLQWKQR